MSDLQETRCITLSRANRCRSYSHTDNPARTCSGLDFMLKRNIQTLGSGSRSSDVL